MENSDFGEHVWREEPLYSPKAHDEYLDKLAREINGEEVIKVQKVEDNEDNHEQDNG